MNKECTGTMYEVGGKLYCVGERKIKKVKGKTVDVARKKSSKNKKSKKNNKSKKC